MQAGKNLQDILTEKISDEDAIVFDNKHLIYKLREQVSAQDCIDLVHKCFDNSVSSGVKCLYITLTRRYCTIQPVNDIIKRLWDVADDQLKEGILWRLLDDESLPEEWHKKIFEYINDNYSTYFKESIISYYGSGEKGLLEAIDSLRDSRFPETKKWIYIFSLMIYHKIDKKSIISTIKNEMQQSESTFTSSVCNYLLNEKLS